MGMSPFSSSAGDYSKPMPIPNPNNPDPMNFSIDNSFQVKKHVVVLINYPNCTNFNGDKICVFDLK